MTTTTLPSFNPPPEAAQRILDDLVDPNLSLLAVARSHNTTLASLTAWMTTPDIAQQLKNMESGSAVKTRLAAASFLPAVANTCYAIILEFNQGQSHMAFTPTETTGREVKRRNSETARRAGALLYRLARFMVPSPLGTPMLRMGSSSLDTPTVPGGSSPVGGTALQSRAPDTPMLRMGSSSSASTPNSGRNPALAPNPHLPASPSQMSTFIDDLLTNPTHLHHLVTNLTQPLTPVPPDVVAGGLSDSRCDPATAPETPILIPSEISSLNSEIPPTPNTPAPAPSELPTSSSPSDPSHPRSPVANSSPPSPLSEPPRNLSAPPPPPFPATARAP